MADTPLATVGITCFNARDTIARALRGALAQDYPTIEIVVVDDASSDGSAAVVRAIAGNDPRVRLIVHERNTGPAGARNTVLGEARGEFVAFFDDDDEALPGRVREQIRVLTDYEAASGALLVACHAAGERRYAGGYVMTLPAIGARPVVPNGPGVADNLLFFGRREGWCYGSGTPTASLLARRSTFAAVGGFDPSLRRVEDADFAVRLALRGGHFVGTSEPLFVQHSTSAPDKSPEANRDAEIAMVRKHRDYLETVGRYHYALRWPQLRYWHFKRNYPRMALTFLGIAARNPLVATRHLLTTGPARLRHEARIRNGGAR